MKNKSIKLIFIMLYLTITAPAFSIDNYGEWEPQIIEKMYILPPKHLNNVLNKDFEKSSLAINLKNTDDKIKTKIETIKNLNKMLSSSENEAKQEIKHQILVQKRDYIKDMSNLLAMKRQQLNTKKLFFQKIESNIKAKNNSSVVESNFLQNQNIAINRSNNLDFKILEDTSSNLEKKSKYFQEYQLNKNALSQLKLAIENHPMNLNKINSDDPQNKIQSIRNYIHNLETKASVLEIKEEMIKHMAKIVALDAMALAENVALTLNYTNEVAPINFNDPLSAISVFTN